MNDRNIAQKVREILGNELGQPLERITDEARIAEDLGADSLDIVAVGNAFENVFGVDIFEEELEKVATVGQMIQLIQAKKGEEAK